MKARWPFPELRATEFKGSRAFDLGRLEEPLAMLMMRPHEMPGTTLDIESIAASAAEQLGADLAPLLSAIRHVSSTSRLDFAQTDERLASALPEGPLTNLVRNIAAVGESPLPLAHLAGMIENGKGRSGLRAALIQATDEQLEAA